MTSQKQPMCALCLAQPAELYCKNDDANLCQACDASYHSSNPLAARHERVPLRQFSPMECNSSAACSLLACSRAESDSDLAVVPDLTAAGGPVSTAPRSGLAFDDAFLGGAGLAGPAFSSGDLLDFAAGSTLLDFDLNDLLDFSDPSPAPSSGGAAEQQPAAASFEAPLLDGLVPAFEPAGTFVQQPAATAPASLLSSQAGFGLPQSLAMPHILPQPSQDLVHMVPQAPTAFIPVPTAVSIPAAASIKQEPVEVAAPKQAVPEVPLTRAERVARYLEKKKRRNFKKVIRYQSRKAYAEVRPRIKGRFATPAEVAALKEAEVAKMAVQQHALPADLDDVAVVPTC